MIPYGYRIINAEAFADEEEAKKIQTFFRLFTAGGQIKPSAEQAGIKKAHPTCKKILTNPIYLGTDYYPQIIEKELFDAAQERVKKVYRERKSNRLIPTLPVYTGFMATYPLIGEERMDPKEYAVYQFGRIKAVW